jgi:hypothetical protein
MIDEGPSSEDIDRFDRETAYCPDCGAEMWDQADVCPKCFAFVGGVTSSKQPIERWFQRRLMVAVIIALLIAFGLIWLMSMPAGH